MKNAVIFYSNTGASEAIARYFSEKLNFPLVDLEKAKKLALENLVLVFPVYCQNIPRPVEAFLRNVSAENWTVVATYGKMSCGNVLREIQTKYGKNIVAAAYVPTRHAYIADDRLFVDYDRLYPVAEKVKRPAPVRLPRLRKNLFADFFPAWRSRVGLKVRRTLDCDGCNVCGLNCSFSAIERGKTDSKCARCLKCVENCPKKALEIKPSLPLKIYLRKKKVDRLITYL